MKRIILILSCALFVKLSSQAQQTFVKSFGVNFIADAAKGIIQTSNKDYVFTGITSTGLPDASLVKIDSAGQTIWEHKFGNAEPDDANGIIQTPVGEYIIVGSSMTPSFDKEAYIIKTNSDGDSLWTRIISGTGEENATDIEYTDDGEYLLTGQYTINDTNVNILFTKINTDGLIAWTKNYGGGLAETAYSIRKDKNGDFVIGGQSVNYMTNEKQAIFFKINSAGDSITSKTYGGVQEDICNYIDTTSDGGYLLLGTTSNFGAGQSDIFLMKTNSSGDSLWYKTYGGAMNDEGMSFYQKNDGSLIIIANTASYGHGGKDLYIISADQNGDTLWTKTYGGAQDETNYAIIPTNDAGYMICGASRSKTGSDDQAYVLKLNSVFNMEPFSANITGDTSLCAGDTVELFSNIDVIKYTWSDNKTTSSILTQTTGDYSIILENFMGFVGYSDTITLFEHPLPDINIVSQKGDTVCSAQETVLKVAIANDNGANYSYEWTGSETTDSLIVNSVGKYNVTLTDFFTCVKTDSISIVFTEMPDTTKICAVGYDTTAAQMKVVWEDVIANNIVSYNIYRMISGNFQLIGSVNYNEDNIYLDADANPLLRPKYKISVVDTCGNESVLSNFHWAMNMAVTQGIDVMNLSWASYYVENDTFAFSNFEIYRGETISTLSKIATVLSDVTTFVDTAQESQTKKMYYIVAGVLTSNCVTGSDSIQKVFTNISDNKIVNNIDELSIEKNITIYPNPCKDYIALDIKTNNKSDISIELFSLTGQKLMQQSYNSQSAEQNHYSLYFNKNKINKGMYILNIKVNGDYYRKQVLKY